MMTLQEAIAYHERDRDRCIEHYRGNCAERVRIMERKYLAACLLAGEGFENVEPPLWGDLTLKLASPKHLARVRRALGVPLKATGHKEPVEKSRTYLWVHVRAEGFDGLTIMYKVRARQAGKCKVVKVRSTSYSRRVVCES